MTTPIVAPAFDCGICDVIHAHHCPKMVSWCPTCIPPITTAARNAVSAFVAQLPAQSQYARDLGEPAPVAARIPLVSKWSA